jgi:hypothetical protein
MSLIRVRQKRRKEGADIRKGKSPRVLIFLLILVVVAIWYLSTSY